MEQKQAKFAINVNREKKTKKQKISVRCVISLFRWTLLAFKDLKRKKHKKIKINEMKHDNIRRILDFQSRICWCIILFGSYELIKIIIS